MTGMLETSNSDDSANVFHLFIARSIVLNFITNVRETKLARLKIDTFYIYRNNLLAIGYTIL